MKPSPSFLYILMILALIWANPTHADCQPNTDAMNRTFQEWLVANTGTSKIRLAIFPFQDASSTENKDIVLSKGLAIALHDTLRAKNVSVLSPLVTLNLSQDIAVTSSDLFDPIKLAPLAIPVHATHGVGGMFQKISPTELRFFVRIFKADDPTQTATFDFTSPIGDRLFSLIGDASQKVLQFVGSKEKTISPYKDVSYEALRYYVKGLDKSYAYDSLSLEVAQGWFDKAVSQSYSFRLAYAEKARVMLMRALLEKAEGKNVSLLVAQAREVLDKHSLHQSQASKRWLKSYQSFIAGVAALQSGQKDGGKLQDSVTRVPEDAIAQHYLGQILGGSSNQAQSKSIELGICL